MSTFLDDIGTPAAQERMRAYEAKCEREAREAAEHAHAAAERLARQESTLSGIDETLAEIPMVREYIEASRKDRELSDETKRCYRTDFAQFRRFAAECDLPPLPADPRLVCAFLLERATRGRRHPGRVSAAIREAHLLAEFPDPTCDVRVIAVRKLIAAKWRQKGS